LREIGQWWPNLKELATINNMKLTYDIDAQVQSAGLIVPWKLLYVDQARVPETSDRAA
jgi:hypothetical protein